MPNSRIPVVFVHGLWLHAISWQQWAQRFADEGYDPVMPAWPGEPDTVAEARAHPETQAGVGVEAISAACAAVIEQLPEPPVLVGHSMGGFVVQHLLGQGIGRAAVAISPGQIKGVKALSPTQGRATFPVLRNPRNAERAVSLTPEQFRFGFANAVSKEESDTLYEKWSMPSPARPLFELALANLHRDSPAKVATDNEERGPLLLLSGKLDHTIPDILTRSTYKQYKRSSAVTEYQRFDDRGHSLIVDSGWPAVTDAALKWLRKHIP
ncbi:alpha/beta fold hydrolase [Streptomyces sp. SDr-06]|uniref:alpha/beta hydrolase n=1 Tax=Streptomyces sp. SDr-06 TaxID=2267702 RepID=UPI000DE96D01|nr:alpha/beta fold hydrolase [Streptomyces sp. SDr-06]RCH64492.1 alpha/beta fold hydrolase [Streptomyces sp. SDr-06]